ncbi:RHS repeat protein [Chitinimonas arctica]|uniref:RHS repeat protein n=1 Tax=Chitinimonas arctica TaxID=2594795 RepID=A0A516SA42_9NEIS|nr:RHS repeat-associated core domain-containing protein [Chitinimonas arctica]QDQ25023.1 RHS repeat protein [Chitinimonas arctica]
MKLNFPAFAVAKVFAVAALPVSTFAAIHPANASYSHSVVDYENVAEPELSLVRTYSSANAHAAFQVPAGALGNPGWTLPFLTEQLFLIRPYTRFTHTYGPFYKIRESDGQPTTYYETRTFNWPGRAVIFGAQGEQLMLSSDTATGPWRVMSDRKASVECIAPTETNSDSTPAPNPENLTAINQVVSNCAAYTVTWRDGRVQTFKPTGPGNVYKLSAFTQANGWSANLDYDPAGNLATVTSMGGRVLSFYYQANGALRQIAGPGGYVLNYSYDTIGNLAAVYGPAGSGERYQYHHEGAPQLLTQVDDAAGALIEKISYTPAKLVSTVSGPDGLGTTTLVDSGDGSRVLTDARGVARSFTFAKKGALQPTTIARSDGSARTIGYDNIGRPNTYADFNGNTTSRKYDSTGTLVTTTYPNGLVSTERTDSTQSKLLELNTPLNKVTYTYDGQGNSLTKTMTAGGQSQTWTYTHDAAGRVTSVTDPRTGKTRYSYDNSGALISVANALDHTWTINENDAHGRPLRITAPTGEVTSYVYDDLGRLIELTTNGSRTTYTYTLHGQLASVSRPNGGSASFTYDSADRLTTIQDATGGRIAYTLDNAGRPLTESRTNALGVVTKQIFTYDPLTGKLDSISNGLGKVTRFSYDANGNLIDQVDALGRSNTYAYDGLNSLISSTRPDGNSILSGYNVLGQIASVITPDGQSTNYTVNGLGQTLKRQSPDTGIEQYTYLPNGLIKTRTDARGKVSTYTYDVIGRVASISYAGGPLINYTYDSARIGALSSIVGGGATVGFGYDGLGQINLLTQTVGSINLTTRYNRDAAGRLNSLTTPSGQVIGFNYASNQSQPNGVSVNGTAIISDLSWLPLSKIPMAWSWANGKRHQRLFDLAGQLVNISSEGALTRKLERDAVGNLTGIVDVLDGKRNQTFAYDELDRLVWEKSNAGRNFTYAYDGNSNRLSWAPDESGSSGNTYDYSGNKLNAITNVATGVVSPISVDAAGSIVKDATRTFTYDSRGRMVSVKKGSVTTNYQYNGLGQRFSKTGGLFVYDLQGHLLGEYDAAGKLVQETVWLENLPVATLRPNGAGVTVFYVQPDELGSPRVVTDTANKVVWRWDSDGFGTVQPNQDPAKTGSKFVYNLRFDGQYYDVESGLHYNYFRDYDPASGRYIQSDPIGLAGGSNTYLYVGANPLLFVDPFGLEIQCTRGGIGCKSMEPGAHFDLPREPKKPYDPGDDAPRYQECKRDYCGWAWLNGKLQQQCKVNVRGACARTPTLCCHQDRTACYGKANAPDGSVDTDAMTTCETNYNKCMTKSF